MDGTDQDIINQLSNQLLGGGAAGQQAPVHTPPQDATLQPEVPTEPPKADPNPTAIEQATKQGEPKDGEGESPIDIYDIKMKDGNVQQFTQAQIANTMERYASLNSRMLDNKDVLDFASRITEQAKKNGYTPKAGEVASFLQEAVKAYTKNPTMGNVDQRKQNPADGQEGQPAQPPADDALANWERDNGLKLPPGFREQNQAMQKMAQQLQQMQQMLVQMQNGGAQSAQQGQQALQQAQKTQEDKIEQLSPQDPKMYLTTYYVEVPVGTTLDKLSYVKDIQDDTESTSDLFKRIQITGDVNTAAPGTYELTYYVVDNSGNSSNGAVLTIVVK